MTSEIRRRTLQLLLPAVVVWFAATVSPTMAAPAPAAASAAAPTASTARPAVRAIPRSQRGERFYAQIYGVDQLQVRSTASGNSLEFRYRVVDPQKASWVNDKKVVPVLSDQRAGIRLKVAQVENLGALRQSVRPDAGKEYWMVFTNSFRRVKPGDKVDIEIGHVRLDGLVVQ